MAGSGLHVGIVGAGVAGLSAAIAMRRIGHQVEVSLRENIIPPILCVSKWHREVERRSNLWFQVFERSQFKNENGAAVSIPPNGARILDYWGFDSAAAGGIENIQVRGIQGGGL